MSTQPEALRLAAALDALLGYRGINADVGKAAAELRRLHAVESKYNELLFAVERYLCFSKPLDNDPVQPLYTHPPRMEWQGLTEEEIQSIHDTYHKRMGPQEFARAVEQALKERNT